jgi:hypothetical protein
MSGNRIIEWMALAATVALLILLKWSHLGVLHYNWFLIILLGWSNGLILLFRNTARRARVNLRGMTS